MSKCSLQLVVCLLVVAHIMVACGGAVSFEPVSQNDDWEPIIQEFDGVQMALVPVGCFMMGSSENEIDYAVDLCEQDYGEVECHREWFEDEEPQHEVCFNEPFWIDVYEVTNAQYGSSGPFPGDSLPRGAVEWFEAVDHCEARGARLPTEAEWEYAARGPDGLIWPWGNEFIAANAVYWGLSGERPAEVGSRPGGVSWVGAYDLSGNMSEWVADWYGSYPSEAQANPSGPRSGDLRVLRDMGDLRSALRFGIDPGYRGNGIGFRCARSCND